MKPSLKVTVLDALTEMKAHNVNALAVSALTSITDHMIIATGTSTKHVKSISDAVLKQTQQLNYLPLGVEGENEAEWILIDLGDVIVHIMLAGTREFYNLEKLWATFDTEEAISA
jgi:ribosome-associated protein